MSIKILNKTEFRRSREVKKIVNYINETCQIPHKVHMHIIYFPCVYDADDLPAWGVFYLDVDMSPIIEIANDFEWYKKTMKIKMFDKDIVEMLLTTICHEICHYFQFRDQKRMIENGVSRRADKLYLEYVNKYSKNKKYELNQEENDSDELEAMDPIKIIWKNAGINL